jgi:DNA-binding MarR family transcriptional regulator
MASDLDIVAHAWPRVHEAIRGRSYRDAADGTILTPRQIEIVSALDGHDPTMVGELADAMGVTPSTMSLNLKRLEERGLVRRSRDPEDRRVMNVRLTAEGSAVRDAAELVDPDRVDALLGVLSPQRRRRAVDGLAMLAEAADRLASMGSEHLSDLAPSRRSQDDPA